MSSPAPITSADEATARRDAFADLGDNISKRSRPKARAASWSPDGSGGVIVSSSGQKGLRFRRYRNPPIDPVELTGSSGQGAGRAPRHRFDRAPG